jgi:hypothetical protein
VRPNVLSALLVIVLLLACACNGDDGGAPDDAGRGRCLDPLPLDCDPSYAPTFEAFYEQRIVRTCGAAGTRTSCHGPEGGQAGLVLSDPDEAHRALLDDSDGTPRVIPNDPECSLLVQRIEPEDPGFMMPPGMRLSDNERCSIRLWIAEGAER